MLPHWHSDKYIFMFPACFYKSCVCKYFSRLYFYVILYHKYFLWSFINFIPSFLMVIEYLFKAYTLIYFIILLPLFEYLGCFQFFTKQVFDEYFSAYGFSIFQGIFLG